MVIETAIFHLAVAPASAPDDEIVDKVSAIIGKTPYETRLRLTGRFPKIAASFNNRQQAEEAASSLKDLGLVRMVIPDSSLRKTPEIFRVRSLKLEEQAVTFNNKSGQSRRMASSELFLILSARLQAYTEVETIKTKRGINITATIMTGGIPVPKKVEEKVVTRAFETESFLRLYDKTSPDSAMEITQHGLDYSFLGSEMAASVSTNYGLAIKRLREAFPQAVFDDSLIDPFGSKTPASMARDAIEINCKLIYWSHLAMTNAGTEGWL